MYVIIGEIQAFNTNLNDQIRLRIVLNISMILLIRLFCHLFGFHIVPYMEPSLYWFSPIYSMNACNDYYIISLL